MKEKTRTPKHCILANTPSGTELGSHLLAYCNLHRTLAALNSILKPDPFQLRSANPPKSAFAFTGSESGTAVLFVEYPASQSPIFLAGIRCYTQSPCGDLVFYSGRVLGDSARSRLMITRAAPGTVISTTDTGNGDGPGHWRYFMIGKKFELIPVSSERHKLTNDEIKNLLRQTKPHTTANLALRNDDLVRIFADTPLPPWIRSILDTQLSSWNKHNAETYYKFTPWPVKGEEFARCIKAAPYWALARWMNQLFPHQINYCIQRSPAGSVAFAIDRVPKSNRRNLLLAHPGEAILFAHEKITDSELLECAAKVPRVAAELRKQFPPELRSKVLTSVVEHAHFNVESVPYGLESDLLDSIAAFPDAWLSKFGGSFSVLMDQIECNLHIRPDAIALLKLYQKLPPNARKSFHEFVPSRI